MREWWDAEHFVFVGRNPERFDDPIDLNAAVWVDWVPMESIPALIDAADTWARALCWRSRGCL